MDSAAQAVGASRRWFYLSILLILGLFFILNNYFYLQAGDFTPAGDETDHLSHSLEHFRFLREGNFSMFFLRPRASYPPLQYYFNSVVFLAGGAGYEKAVMAQSLFILILIFSTYFLGELLWDENVGFLAAIASVCYPFLAFISHKLFLDIGLCSFLAFSLYCLFKTENFKNGLWTVLFFVGCALGMMTKITFLTFIAIPFLMTAWPLVKELKKDSSTFKQAVLLIITSSAVAGVCIFLNWSEVLDEWQPHTLYLTTLVPLVLIFVLSFFYPVKDSSVRSLIRGGSLFLILIWHFYGFNGRQALEFSSNIARWGWINVGVRAYNPLNFLGVLAGTLGIPGSVLPALGLIIYLAGKNKTAYRNILAIGLAASIAVVFLPPLRDLRYCLPCVVFTVPFAVAWIMEIKWKPVRAAVCVIFILSAFFGWAGYQVTGGSPDDSYKNLFWNSGDFHFIPPGYGRIPGKKISSGEQGYMGGNYITMDEAADLVDTLKNDQNTILLILWQEGMPGIIRFQTLLNALQVKDPSSLGYIEGFRGERLNGRKFGKARLYLVSLSGKNREDSLYRQVIILKGESRDSLLEMSGELTEILERSGISGKTNFAESYRSKIPSDMSVEKIILRQPLDHGVMDIDYEYEFVMIPGDDKK